MASEPYGVGSQVKLAYACHPSPGTVVSYELIRKAREWNPDDHDRYRYVVRWNDYLAGVLVYTSSELAPRETTGE